MKKGIFSAVFIISIFTVADRFLGFIFKIFLSRSLGAEQMGIYQVSLSFFFVLLTATTSGIPLIVSKLTAKYRTEKDIKSERSLTSAALLVGIIIASLISGVTLALYRLIAKIMTWSESATILLYMLPALIFSAVYGALRGNLWGRQRYFSVSVVEVVEQIARIITCVLLFYFGLNKLVSAAISLTLGCFVSMLSVIIFYALDKGKLASPKGQIAPLLKSSTPITVSRASSSLVSSLIAIIVPFLLVKSGFTRSDAISLYGSSVGMAMPLIYIPITIVGSLAFVMIPTVSSAMSEGKTFRVNAQIENAIAFSIVLASCFVPIFSALGNEIGAFVYSDAAAGRFIKVSSWLLIPLAIESITSSVMNSLDLEMKSFINYLIGAGVTFGVCFAFYGNFTVEVFSFAQGVGWCVSAILHILAIKKKTGLNFSFAVKLIFCVLLIAPSKLLSSLLYSLFSFAGTFTALAISSILTMAFFLLLCLVFGVLKVNLFSSKRKKLLYKGKSLAK